MDLPKTLKSLLFCLLFLLLTTCLIPAQNISFALRSDDSTTIKHPLQLTDGRIATIIGKFNSDSLSGSGIAFFDSLGNFLTSISIGLGGGGHYLGPDLIQDADDNLLLLFTNSHSPSGSSANWECRLAKLKPDGSLIWDITLRDSVSLMGGQLLQAANGDYLIAGTAFSAGSTNYNDYYLARIKPNGAPRWGKIIGSTRNERGNSIVELPGGDLMMIGISGIAGDLGSLLTRLDSAGNLKWAKLYKAPNHYYSATGMILDSRGTLAFTGTTTLKYSSYTGKSKAFITQADTNGNLIWTKVYDGIWYERENGRAILETKEKGYVLAGNTNFPYGAASIDRSTLLIKTDSNGSVLHAANLGIKGEDHVYLAPHSDGGYLVGAIRFWVPTGNPSWQHKIHGWLFKTGPDLLVGCLDSNRTAEYSGFPVAVPHSNVSLQVHDHINVIESDSSFIMKFSTQFMCGLTSVSQDAPRYSLKVYPNPSFDKIWIECQENLVAGMDYQLALSHLQGRQLLQQSGKWPVQNKISLELQDLPQGVYILSLIAPEGRWTGKLIKQ